MADLKFYPRITENEGWVDEGASPTPFNAPYFAGQSVETFRHFIWRISDVDIPAGATISGAALIFPMYVKTPTDANGITYDFYYEASAPAGANIRQDALPLRLGVQEESTAQRNWVLTLGNQTWSWVPIAGPAADQQMIVNVTSLITTAINTNAGRHMNLAFKMKILTETGDVGISANAREGKAPYLQITYTGGTARNEVVLYNDNPQLQNPDPNGMAAGWFKNSIFGFFSANTTYSLMTSDGAITAPQGGTMMKLTPTDTNRQAAWHKGPNHTIPPGTWATWSIFVYVPSGSNYDVIISPFSGLNGQGERISVKNTWVRTYFQTLSQADTDVTLGITTGEGVTVGAPFYIANHNWTPGRILYPYFDGDTTDSATYHRTFDWGGGTTGKNKAGYSYVVLDSAPTATGINPQTSQSTGRNPLVTWTYTDTYGEGMTRSRAEIRKKKIP